MSLGLVHIYMLCRQHSILILFSVPKISAYTRWNCLTTTEANKSRSTLILTVCCSFQRVFCLGSVRSGIPDPYYDYKAATTTTGPDPTKYPTDVRQCTSESRPCYKIPLSGMFSQRHKLRSELQVQHMLCMGAREMFRTLNTAQYRIKVIGPATPTLPHRPSNRHHQHPHHLYPLLRLPNKSVTTARSTSYSSI